MANKRAVHCRTKVGKAKKWRASTLRELDDMAAMRALVLGGDADMWKSTVPLTDELKRTVRYVEQAKQQAVKNQSLIARAEGYDAPKEGAARVFFEVVQRERGFTAGVRSLLSRDSWVREAGENVATRVAQYKRVFESQWVDGLVWGRKGLLPGSEKEYLDRAYETIEALYGAKTVSPEAAKSAAGWKAANDLSWEEYRRWGGDPSFRDDYNAPNPEPSLDKIRTAGREKFIEAHLSENLLNPQRMFRARGWPIGEDKETLRAVLGRVYDKIAEGNAAPELEPGAARDFANKWIDHRVLQFADGKAWRRWNDLFGKSDPHQVLWGHLKRRAELIGAMRVLGPKPDHAVAFLAKEARRRGMPPRAVKRIESDWGEVSGKLGRTVHLLPSDFDDADAPWYERAANRLTLRGVAVNIRHLQAASKLGSAIWSSISDYNTMRIVRKMNGLPAFRVLQHYGSMMSVAERRKLGTILQLGADEYMSGVAAGLRFGESIGDGTWAAKLSEWNLRASGLTAVTSSRSKMIGSLLLNEIEEQSGDVFEKVNPAMRGWLEKHGIGPREWDIIAASEGVGPEGLKFKHVLGVEKVREFVNRTTGEVERLSQEQAEAVGYKLFSYIERMQEFAVPQSNFRARAAFTRGTAVGTAWGEIARNIGLFKNFSVMQVVQWFPLMLQSSPMKGTQLLADLVIGGMVMGAPALWNKDLSKGNLPRGWSHPEEFSPSTEFGRKFWMEAALQGGGLGILGDFLLTETSRYGQSLPETVAGPAFGFVGDLIRVASPTAVVGGFSEEGASYFGDIVRFLGREAPFQSLWYWRAAWQRAFLDRLDAAVDPAAQRRQRRYESELRTKYRSGVWWGRGDPLPGQ